MEIDNFIKPIFEELKEEWKIANDRFKFWFIVAPYFEAKINESWNAGDNSFPYGEIIFVLEGTITAGSFRDDFDAKQYFEDWEFRMRNRWTESFRSRYWIDGVGYNVNFDLKSALA